MFPSVLYYLYNFTDSDKFDFVIKNELIVK